MERRCRTRAWPWVIVMTGALLGSVLGTPQIVRSQTPSPRPGLVSLDFRAPSTEHDPASEARLLDLLNDARREHSLVPLIMDAPLRAVARAHSRDMAVRGYFGHTSLSGQSFLDRVGSAVGGEVLIGENVAISQTAEQAHAAFTASPGHYKNMLEPKFRRVGIGISTAGKLGLIVTEDFSE